MAARSKTAIVNEAFVRKFFSAGDPIGRTFTMSRVDYVIVGVAQDARSQNLRSPVAPLAYSLVEQDPGRLRRLALIVRCSGPSGAIGTLTSAIHTAAREAGGLRIARVATLRELVDASVADERLAAAVSAGAGALAVALVAAGLFGTVAYTVTCRTRELGIRAALGGGRWAILRMLMHETLVFVLAGIGLGLPLAIATARLLSSKFFGVGLLDPLSLVASVVLMTTVTMAAGIVPAYRAAGAHPMIALRHE